MTQRGLFDFDGSGTVKILDRLSGLFEGRTTLRRGRHISAENIFSPAASISTTDAE